jgi:hypothetical protein
MRKEENRPSWWLLWLLGLGLIGLLILGAMVPLSERGHTAAAIGIVVLAWIVVEAWLRANRRALLHVDGLTLVELPDADAETDLPNEERAPAPASRQAPGLGQARIAAVLPPAEVTGEQALAR